MYWMWLSEQKGKCLWIQKTEQDSEDDLLTEDLYTRENRGRIFIVFKE